MRTHRTALGAACLLAAMASPNACLAYLGGFEEQDGYHYGPPNASGLGNNDVTRYNAGQYGVNNGGPGGAVTPITPDTGLWDAVLGGRNLNQTSDYYVIRHSAPGAPRGMSSRRYSFLRWRMMKPT